VLVTRDITERPEAVEANLVKLVGTDSVLLVDEVRKFLASHRRGAAVVPANPYGDGLASRRIVEALKPSP
jgi:UDP-N-acetylglucosamine 2-epimerase (non-hydrolysing)